MIQRSIEPCKKAMADAQVDRQQIDEVVLVGGQTRTPRIQQLVKDLFRRNPIAASIRMRWLRSARRFRPACWREKSRICCCSTSPVDLVDRNVGGSGDADD